MCVVVVVDPADVRSSEGVKAAVCGKVVLVAVSQVPPEIVPSMTTLIGQLDQAPLTFQLRGCGNPVSEDTLA